VRTRERKPILCLRLFSAWRARFCADLMFATFCYRVREQRAAYYSGPAWHCQSQWAGAGPVAECRA
jgi:hypothetical protein